MLPKPSLSDPINQPSNGLLNGLQHSTSQHESNDDAGSPAHAAGVLLPPSPASTEREMANAGPHSRSGADQGHIQGNVRHGQGAGLDSEPSRTGSAESNEPSTVASENHPARQEPSSGPVTQPMAFKDQNTHLVPISTPQSQMIGSFDVETAPSPSSTPTATGVPSLPPRSANLQIEWEEDFEPTGILTLPLELRKKIYAHLLIVDMISAEEKAMKVLPGNGFGSSLGVHTQILRADKQIHLEAMDVLYGSNDWLLVSIEDEDTLQATFKLLRMPQRCAINASPRFAPFMEINISISRGRVADRHGRGQGYSQSKDFSRKFIVDLASFNRLCNNQIHKNGIDRQVTYLQVWHHCYHPDEPRHTAVNRSRMEKIIGRMDARSRWCVSRAGDDPQRLSREAITYITGDPSLHQTRPQMPRHIFTHIKTIVRLAQRHAARNDNRAVRFFAMDCLRYVHAATLDWCHRNPIDIDPRYWALFTHIARMTTSLVLRGMELTIEMGNVAQAHDAGLVVEELLWTHHDWTPTNNGVALMKMTKHEHACLIFLQAKACQSQGYTDEAVFCLQMLFSHWSESPTQRLTEEEAKEFFAEAPHWKGLIERKGREKARYNWEFTYSPLLALSVEQFLRIGKMEEKKIMEGVLQSAMDFRLHNWLGSEERIEAVGPCLVWPWSKAWLNDWEEMKIKLPESLYESTDLAQRIV